MAAAMATSFATGLRSFGAFRFALGLGEAGNWPGATKAVSEWFPRRESGWAVALFDSGSSVGGALAPFIVLTVYHTFGGWQPAFLLTGTLGLIWLVVFRALYRQPENHPRLSEDERRYILSERAATSAPADAAQPALPYSTLLRLPQMWGYVISKSFTDPVWFFITDWFAIYLVAKGFALEDSLMGFWVPFLAADLGNFFGGGVSSYLIARGWRVGTARKAIAVFGTVGMLALAPTVGTSSFAVIVTCFAIATFSYAALSTVILNLPADLFPSGSVASVSGMGGTGAGFGTIGAIYLTGWVADHYSFEPILLGASAVPLVGLAAMLLLVRNNAATRAGIVQAI
jgi:ACS family hexuronate transporter-like MFS transporter